MATMIAKFVCVISLLDEPNADSARLLAALSLPVAERR
jgi:hypothetical protein